ncbi:HET-domain-containing protein, partial [Cadophora sp. DSE1049]
QQIRSQPDVGLIRSWFEYCRSNHDGKCKVTSEQVQNLRVIDCSTTAIIPAPTACSYVALSYVWGNHKTDEDGNGPSRDEEGLPVEINPPIELPVNLPAVVKDAVKFTKKLGFDYLWIDKYCIDQTNGGLMQQQIMSMDRIYQNAEFTIIAAAGDDENHGLLGVGETRRPVQPTAQIGNLTFTSSARDPFQEIIRSKWFSRGWTFQEGILTRRRLAFTKQQIYFECD